jgi:hypothetical protein
MLARFNAATLQNGTLCCINRAIGQGFVDTEHWTFELISDGTIKAASIAIGSVGEAISVATYSANTDTCAAAIFTSDSNRTIYVNNTALTNTTAVSTPHVGDTQIGARVIGPNQFDTFRRLNSCLSEIAIYNTALSASDVAAFVAGRSPLLIQPKNLVLLSPFMNANSATVNLKGEPLTLNLYDGTVTDCVSPRLIPFVGARPGLGTIPVPVPTVSRRFYFIERMDNRIWPTIEDAWCLDAALAYPQPEPDATLEASSATGDGAIREYNIINGGSGYTSPIGQIQDAQGTGSGATVSLGLTSGAITTATATAIGADYVHPILTILDATGFGAVVQPLVSNYATFSANANVFDTGNIGDIIRMGGGQAEIVSFNSANSVIGNITVPITAITPNDPDDIPLPATSGNWSVTTPTGTVHGLWHLEGRTVSALANGGAVSDLTVTDGAVTLPVSASQVLVGLPFTAQLQTMYLDASGGPTIQSRRKSGVQAVLRVENSRAPEIGMNQPDAAAQPNQAQIPWTSGPPNGMTDVKFRTPSMPAGQPSPLFSGDLDLTALFGTYDYRGQVAVQQRDPVPLSLSAVVLWTTIGDSTGQ